MKNLNSLILPAVSLVIVLLMSFTFAKKEPSNPPIGGDKFEIPTDIQEIFDKSCFGCHNSESQSDKAKKKFQIDHLSELSKTKLVGTMDGIAEVINKNEMPPEKFLEKYPDKKLSEEDAKKLKEWAENTAENLMK